MKHSFPYFPPPPRQDIDQPLATVELTAASGQFKENQPLIKLEWLGGRGKGKRMSGELREGPGEANNQERKLGEKVPSFKTRRRGTWDHSTRMHLLN